MTEYEMFIEASRKLEDEKKKSAKLRKLVRSFLTETESVPFRNIECNQDKVFDLIDRLMEASNHPDRIKS